MVPVALQSVGCRRSYGEFSALLAVGYDVGRSRFRRSSADFVD